VATSNDHPGLPFLQAAGYTRGRPDGPPLWVVIHDMEASEHSGRAESTAAYFANPPDGRQVSSHFTVDNDSVIQCVDEDDIAWTVGNRPGNYRGINWELSGFANQTRAQWLDAFGVAMFAEMAPIAAASMRRWGIPNRWCSIADLQARRPGLTTHNDLRIAFGGTTHTDPGPNFPFDYLQQVLEAALNEEDDMDTNQSQKLDAIFNAWLTVPLDTDNDGTADQPFPVPLTELLKDIQAKLADPVPVEVDADAVAAALIANPDLRAFLVEASRQGAEQAEDS
jgi:hypothetical protein